MNDCENCIHFDENVPVQCSCFEWAYYTMEKDGKCKQYIEKQKKD